MSFQRQTMAAELQTKVEAQEKRETAEQAELDRIKKALSQEAYAADAARRQQQIAQFLGLPPTGYRHHDRAEQRQRQQGWRAYGEDRSMCR